MADTSQQLTFLAWCRPQVCTLVTGQQSGRASASAALTLTESDASGSTVGTQTRALPFLIAGPADITGVQPGAIVRRYPPPGTIDHESNRCPYIEVADPTLPWRYTPAATPIGPNLHPWLVLLTGPVTELAIHDGEVTVPPSAQQDPQAVSAPADPYRYAHVQVDAVGHRITRILSARSLQPGTDYLAVVVPAFDINGAPAWHGTAPVTLPVYDSWQFRTAVPAGSFEDLAARLRPGDAPTSTGQAQLSYPRLPQAPQLEMLGALAARTPDGTATEAPLARPVADDVAQLRNTPRKDERGRPVVALPRYGDAWSAAAPTSAWGTALNADPRHRGVAGLGLEVAIRRQEELVADVLDNLGAVRESRQRIRHLALGVAATRSLWQRRVPADPQTRLWLLGPALNRLVTDAGTVAELATADDRTPARGTFSAAARRVLRAGPARTASIPLTPTALLASANRQPPPIPAETDGLPLDATRLQALDKAGRTAIQAGRVDAARLAAAVTELAARTPPALQSAAGEMAAAVRQAAQAGRAVPWGSVVSLLAGCDAALLAKRADPGAAGSAALHDLGDLRTKVTGPQGQSDDANLTELLAAVGPLQPNDPPQQPLALDSLAAGVNAAFDPTPVIPSAAARVLSTISGGADGGIDPAAPLAPPEPCIGLDRPAWADLAAEFNDWLLPGAAGLDANSVIALQSNAGFIDAYLVGLNTQLLGELRWRNIPIATACTPVRRFWDRADTASGQRADDIVGVASWPAGSGLGDTAHHVPGATGRELVIVVRGDLLLRYPSTLVYLRSALHPPSTVADFDHDPDPAAPRVLPGFHGRLGDDIVFFGFPDIDGAAVPQYWLVFEEPPAGYRFANDRPSTATAGHAWAADTLVQPVRVLIRGDSLIPAGHQ